MEDSSVFPERTSFHDLNEAIEAVRTQISQVIVGQPESIDLLLTGMLSGGHILIEGVPGIAKTLTARLLAASLEIPFTRIQFTPDLMPSDVLGTAVFNQRTMDFEFRKGPVFSGIVLIDEINRAPAKTQSALFEVMEERQVSIDGKVYAMHDPFMVLATQNPIEQEGTYRLPEAQLDRFLFKLLLNYPSLEEESEIIRRHHRSPVADLGAVIKPVLSAARVRALKSQVRGIHIEEELIAYIARIVHETRIHKGIYLGASPRASISLLMASKALSALRGRDFVSPDEIRYLAAPVLRHRLILSPEKEMEGSTSDQLISEILQKIEVPR